MRVVAYTALHYGKAYLRWAIRSVIDHVNEYVVLYSPIGSHGHRTDVPCPESRAELMAEAMIGAGKKLKWFDGTWAREADQRNAIYQVAPDADAILVLDADEVWQDGLAEVAISHAIMGKDRVRHWRIPIIHYWRSFYKAVLHDPAFPVRVIVPNGGGSEATLQFFGGEDRPLTINHFGYAQSAAIVEYKQRTHGHRPEWRTDIHWFKDRFLCNAQVDCHPVGSKYWNPESVDPMKYMPSWMMEHPFAEPMVIP